MGQANLPPNMNLLKIKSSFSFLSFSLVSFISLDLLFLSWCHTIHTDLFMAEATQWKAGSVKLPLPHPPPLLSQRMKECELAPPNLSHAVTPQAPSARSPSERQLSTDSVKLQLPHPPPLLSQLVRAHEAREAQPVAPQAPPTLSPSETKARRTRVSPTMITVSCKCRDCSARRRREEKSEYPEPIIMDTGDDDKSHDTCSDKIECCSECCDCLAMCLVSCDKLCRICYTCDCCKDCNCNCKCCKDSDCDCDFDPD